MVPGTRYQQQLQANELTPIEFALGVAWPTFWNELPVEQVRLGLQYCSDSRYQVEKTKTIRYVHWQYTSTCPIYVLPPNSPNGWRSYQSSNLHENDIAVSTCAIGRVSSQEGTTCIGTNSERCNSASEGKTTELYRELIYLCLLRLVCSLESCLVAGRRLRTMYR